MKTLIDIIKELEKTGHSVSYTHRKDGGYIIHKIDGQHYRGKTGNVVARQITGATLSQARTIQLARIRTPKGKRAVKRTEIPDDLKKQLRKIQRLWRKNHPDIRGTLSTRGLRYQIEQYGEEAARQSLDKGFRYAEGYAYIENVNFLVERIENDIWKSSEDTSSMEEVVQTIRTKALTFREDWMQPIYEILYEWEKHTIEAKECARQITAIIGK